MRELVRTLIAQSGSQDRGTDASAGKGELDALASQTIRLAQLASAIHMAEYARQQAACSSEATAPRAAPLLEEVSR